jgi:hypothetical protein
MADALPTEVVAVEQLQKHWAARWDVLLRFLLLVRDNYPVANHSAYFMEEVARIEHKVSIVNLRDVLSHLATLLAEDTPADEWEAQLAEAAAHFRRAIQEPYHISIGDLRGRFDLVRARYERLLPRMQKLQDRGLFHQAPTVQYVEQELAAIASLASDGRDAKARNRTDGGWSEGCGHLADAYHRLDKLAQELSSHIYQFEARGGSSWSRAGMIATVIFGTVGVVSLVLTIMMRHGW